MILVTHSIVGTALARKFSHYSVVFVVAVISHYIFDRIPHWHYPVPAIKKATLAPLGKKSFSFSWEHMPDVVRVAVDLALGVGLSFLFFDGSAATIFIAALGAALPDLLVGFAKLWPQPILVAHDRFHRWNHTAFRLDDRPLVGIGSQIVIVLIFVFFF